MKKQISLNKERFEEYLVKQAKYLVYEWEKNTKFMSSCDRMIEDQAFQKIINMGPQVIPVIFNLMVKNIYFCHWYLIFKYLGVKVDLPAKYMGHIDMMNAAYEKWGYSQGFTGREYDDLL